MQVLIYIIIGISGGILGGLGMGGGTLLIPLLITFTALNQHAAQAVNLVAFIPMATVVLIIHLKNGLIKFKYLLTISLPALGLGLGAAYLVQNISASSLKRYFGIFLLLLGGYQLACIVIKSVQNGRKNSKKMHRLRVMRDINP